MGTKEKIEKLVKAGLTHIYISLNAGSPESHETIMGVKGKYEHVVNVIKESLTIPGLDTQAPVVSGSRWLESAEVERIKDIWSDKVIYFHSAGNWAGKMFPLEYTPRYSKCLRLMNNIYVNLKGDVCLCCFDPFGNYKFGNVRHQTLEEIWWGEKRKIFMDAMKNKGRGCVKPCKDCSTI